MRVLVVLILIISVSCSTTWMEVHHAQVAERNPKVRITYHQGPWVKAFVGDEWGENPTPLIQSRVSQVRNVPFFTEKGVQERVVMLGRLSADCLNNEYLLRIAKRSPSHEERIRRLRTISSLESLNNTILALAGEPIYDNSTGRAEIAEYTEIIRDIEISPIFYTLGAELSLPVQIDGVRAIWNGFIIDHHTVAFIPQENLNWNDEWTDSHPRAWRDGDYRLVAPNINGNLNHAWLKSDTLRMNVPVYMADGSSKGVKFSWTMTKSDSLFHTTCPDSTSFMPTPINQR